MGGIEQAPWVRVRCDLARHPRLEGLTHRARWLYLVGLLEAGETRSDGELRPARVKAVLVEAECFPRHAQELAAAGLWIPADHGGYRIRDYLEHQQSRAEREAVLKQNRTRVARHRARQKEQAGGMGAGLQAGSNGVTPGVTYAVSHATRSRDRERPSYEGAKPARPGCPDCGAVMPPGVYLEDHRRISHGVDPGA